jgi:hypothetical protein
VDVSTLLPATYDRDGGGDSTVAVGLGADNVFTANFGFVAWAPIPPILPPIPVPASTPTAAAHTTTASSVKVKTGIPAPDSGAPWMILLGVLVLSGAVGTGRRVFRRW